MRRLLCILVAALCCTLTGCTAERPAVIENPAFEVWNSSTLEVAKVEMSDSATILTIHAYYRPKNWIRIDSGTYLRANGDSTRKLLVQRADGIMLNEEFYMPESGEHTFTLWFPALAKDVSTIDLIESDCDACFKILGIALLPSVRNIDYEALPKSTGQPLPPPSFTNSKIKVSGKLLGYNTALGEAKVSIHGGNVFGDAQTVLPVSADGSFAGEVDVNMVQAASVVVSIGESNYSFYTILAPQQEQVLYYDLRRKSRLQARLRSDKIPADSIFAATTSPYFSPQEMDKMAYAVPSLRGKEFYSDVLGLAPDKYKDYVLNAMEQADTAMPAAMSAAAKKFAQAFLRMQAVDMLLNYAKMQERAAKWANKDNAKKVAAPKTAAPSMEYYSFLKELLSDEMTYLPEFAHLCKALIAAEVFAPAGTPTQHSPSDRFIFFKEKRAALLENHPLVQELAAAQIYAEQIEKARFFDDSDKQQIRTLITNSAIADALIAASDSMQSQIAAAQKRQERNASVVREVPKVSNDKLLGTILEKYKGKVVVADFWATWCGPCRMANKALKPLKEELKDKDVVFLYITGETSPLSAWQQAIPDIRGEHYRLSAEQWKAVGGAMKIESIPTFFIYNKQGKQTYTIDGFDGVEKFREEIVKVLN